MLLLKILFLLCVCRASSLAIENQFLDEIFSEVNEELRWMDEVNEGRSLVPGHGRNRPSEGAQKIMKWNEFISSATEKLVERTGLDLLEAQDMVIAHSKMDNKFGLIDVCQGVDNATPCSTAEINSIFPPLDGRCNNIQNPLTGTANRPFRRILSPCVRDIINTRNTIRPIGREDEDIDWSNVQVSSRKTCSQPSSVLIPEINVACPSTILPNARLVSRTFHKDVNIPSSKVNQFFTIFAQIVDHDLTLTTFQTLPPNTNCCSIPNNTNLTRCLNIIVPSGDSFFPNGKCLLFPRSAPFCATQGCTADTINELTAFIDAGFIYGSDSKTGKALRSFSKGLLLTSNNNMLPRITTSAGPFLAGDVRDTENPALASLHTIFLREHNRIARLIAAKKPLFNDELIYQNARRIVIAEVQNIVFGEFLSLLLGNHEVFPASTITSTYNEKIDPSIFQEFGVSAFRFGHSLLNSLFNRLDPTSGNLLSSYLLRNSFDQADLYCQGNCTDSSMTSITKGMTIQAAQAFDNFLTADVTNFLFALPKDKFSFGQDLAVRNIQRARDNKVAGWVNYRFLCSNYAPINWNDRPSDISQSKWNTLQSLYDNVADIDLFTGSLAEDPASNSLLGATSSCIIEDQFVRILQGDRYFFTHANGASKFSPSQISKIRKITMFDIVCLNTNIKQLQKRIFENVSNNNPLIACTNAIGINVNDFF